MPRAGLTFTLRRMMIVVVIAGVELGIAAQLRNAFHDDELYPELALSCEAFLHGIACAILFVIRVVIRLLRDDQRYATDLRRRFAAMDVRISESGEVRDET